MRILIVGYPNTGKTTLFNQLTAQHERVGNWAGVTVQAHTGVCHVGEDKWTLVDLPGVYHIQTSEFSSRDADITLKTLQEGRYDYVINVVDASCLDKQLYLTTQLLDLKLPTMVMINTFMSNQSIETTCDLDALSRALGCPVLWMHPCLSTLKKALADTFKQMTQVHDRRSFGEDVLHTTFLEVEARHQKVRQLCQQVVRKSGVSERSSTSRIDRWVLHPYLGLPLFLVLLYGLFFIAIHGGRWIQPTLDGWAHQILMEMPLAWMTAWHWPMFLEVTLIHGLGQGLCTTISFIPVMMAMYMGLSFFERSGYMARVAFLMDRIMRFLGLPGHAFVPLLIGFGCNVPAIFATRTLAYDRDRWMTMIMTPFMSCSARLTIYAVFAASFFPSEGQNIIFSLYIMGIVMAILTGLLWRGRLSQKALSPLVLTLPSYHTPSWRLLCRDVLYRLRVFLIRAGGTIIPVCICLGILHHYTLTGQPTLNVDRSILATWGHWVTPLFAPMGMSLDNWPATVALMTGVLAKEVVLGTLNTLYVEGAQGIVSHFQNAASAYAYLLFILLYVPCVSTVAALRSEGGRNVMWFSVGWSTFVAYSVATVFYQLATMSMHFLQSLLWILGIVMCLMGVIGWIRRTPWTMSSQSLTTPHCCASRGCVELI